MVTDIRLRGTMDGWEVAHQAREVDPDSPIIYMSGQNAAECVEGRSQQHHAGQPFAPAQRVAVIANSYTGTPT